MTTGTELLTGHLLSLGRAAGTPSRRQKGNEKSSGHALRQSTSGNAAVSITPTESGFCIILKELNATKAAQKSPSLKIQ